MGFGKIFDSTFTGSMVGNGPTVFAVWAYVIANTKPPGIVELNPVILSAIIGTPIDDVLKALSVLTSPDPRSRTKVQDGKRLIPVGEFCYEVPTWQQYRDARNDEERKAYNAEAQRKHRAKKSKSSNHSSLTVNDNKHPSAKAEAEAEAEAVPPKEPTPASPAVGVKKDVRPTSPEALAISRLFNRRETTPWTTKEIAAFKDGTKRGAIIIESIEAIAAYYASERAKGGNGIHRRDLLTFLNNFDGELDRANAFKSNPKAHERTNSNQRADSSRNIGHNANLDYSKRTPEAEARNKRELLPVVQRLLQGLPAEEQSEPRNGA